jgi:hypothetical protein
MPIHASCIRDMPTLDQPKPPHGHPHALPQRPGGRMAAAPLIPPHDLLTGWLHPAHGAQQQARQARLKREYLARVSSRRAGLSIPPADLLQGGKGTRLDRSRLRGRARQKDKSVTLAYG